MDELDPANLFATLRRWKKLFLTVTLGLMALFFIFAAYGPNYRSTAFVQIEQPEISANATLPVGSAAHTGTEEIADQHISAIEQKVTSDAALAEIIDKLDLYAGARGHQPMAQIVKNMRKKIRVELIGSTLANPSSSHIPASGLTAIAFKLSFDAPSPRLAQRVAEELVSRFLHEDMQEHNVGSEETTAFLARQIDAMESDLSSQEKKIADYQKLHGISNANSLMFNQQLAATLGLSLQTLDSQITANEGTLGGLRAQLATTDPYARLLGDGRVMSTPLIQLKSLQAQYATLSAHYGPEHPDVIRTRHQIEALQNEAGLQSDDTAMLKAQIADARADLQASQKTYGAEHPDTVALRNKLQQLEEQLTLHRPSVASNNGILEDADNPVYLQAAAQLRSAEEQHKALLRQRDELVAQQQKYQNAVAENPEVAQQMAALSRDYDNAQLRYRALKEKKLAADMDRDMKFAHKGQRLTVINPPDLPLDTHPMRLLLLIGGVVLSVLGGLASILAAQTLNRCVIGAQDLESLTGAAPLIAIPHILTGDEHKNSLRQKAVRLQERMHNRLSAFVAR